MQHSAKFILVLLGDLAVYAHICSHFRKVTVNPCPVCVSVDRRLTDEHSKQGYLFGLLGPLTSTPNTFLTDSYLRI